jgi:gluconolactonase
MPPLEGSGIRELIDERVEIEQLGSGFQSAEGPIWIAEGGYLLFSDVAGDRRCRWDEANGVQVVASPSNKGNGQTLDTEGRLVVCEHVTHAIARMDASGTGAGREVLVSAYEGRELNSPNDVVVGPDGSIYFSDPPGGRNAHWGVDRPRELDFEGVYRLPPDGASIELQGDDFALPNGLCFSPGEASLYVNETMKQRIRVFELAVDGSLENGRVFADGIGDRERGTVDGMKCDVDGNVWVTGPGALWVFRPDGEWLGALGLPERALNFNWGGTDWSWLFICTVTGLYRVPTKTRGREEPYMRRAG